MSHSWEVLAEILKLTYFNEFSEMLLVIGMPIFYKHSAYNCLVAIYNGRIELIRPKMALCYGDNYRESRWFVAWRKNKIIEDFLLPELIRDASQINQKTCPFGDAIIQTFDDISIGFEICEEMWTTRSSHIDLSLDGVDIILNASASYHVLRKSNQRLNRLILAATEKNGGIYLFANQRGCDGDRLYYDGNATIAQNGHIYAQGAQFDLMDIEVSTAVLDIEANICYCNRLRSSRFESCQSQSYPIVPIDMHLCLSKIDALKMPLSESIHPLLPSPEEEIASGPPVWLWDYLRRSKQDLALQNVQARLRMVISYLFAQLSLWVEGRCGSLLVLGTSNVDECLRGYMTKYDCSSADINPIGSISKLDLKRFLRFCSQQYQLTSLDGILNASPTAELVPLKDGQIVQTDEIDMGMTYAELSEFGLLRRPGSCGPYSMFIRLLGKWHRKYPPKEIADKVKHFFRCYALNRHKATVLTPAYHAENYSPDDHRHDLRPFLYNAAWSWQFLKIDQTLALLQ